MNSYLPKSGNIKCIDSKDYEEVSVTMQACWKLKYSGKCTWYVYATELSLMPTAPNDTFQTLRFQRYDFSPHPPSVNRLWDQSALLNHCIINMLY